MARSIRPCILSVIFLTLSLSCTRRSTVAAIRQFEEDSEARYRSRQLSIPEPGARSEETVQSLFEEWMDRHSKSYGDTVEESIRFIIFKDNLRRIDEHNRMPSLYKMGLTKFADLTEEEFRALFMRTRHRRHVRLHQSPSFSYSKVEVVAKTVDWRKKGAVTPVKYQGLCGSCWAFSTIAAVEGLIQIKTGRLVPLSGQELGSCDVTQRNQGCKGGHMDYGFEFIAQNGGIDSESDYPYTAGDDSCNYHKKKKFAATIMSYEDVPANNERDLQRAVAHQPVSVAIDAGDGDFQLYISESTMATAARSWTMQLLLWDMDLTKGRITGYSKTHGEKAGARTGFSVCSATSMQKRECVALRWRPLTQPRPETTLAKRGRSIQVVPMYIARCMDLGRIFVRQMHQHSV